MASRSSAPTAPDVTTVSTRRSVLAALAGGLLGAGFGEALAAPSRRKRKKRRRAEVLVMCPKSGPAERCGSGCCPDGYLCCDALHGVCVREGQMCG